MPFSSILFEELLHKGTFKVVHHAVVNYPPLGIMSQPVAVKRLKGVVDSQLHMQLATVLVQSMMVVYRHAHNDCVHRPIYADDKSELGMEELMGETYTLKAVQNKVCLATQISLDQTTVILYFRYLIGWFPPKHCSAGGRDHTGRSHLSAPGVHPPRPTR